MKANSRATNPIPNSFNSGSTDCNENVRTNNAKSTMLTLKKAGLGMPSDSSNPATSASARLRSSGSVSDSMRKTRAANNSVAQVEMSTKGAAKRKKSRKVMPAMLPKIMFGTELISAVSYTKLTLPTT